MWKKDIKFKIKRNLKNKIIKIGEENVDKKYKNKEFQKL